MPVPSTTDNDGSRPKQIGVSSMIQDGSFVFSKTALETRVDRYQAVHQCRLRLSCPWLIVPAVLATSG